MGSSCSYADLLRGLQVCPPEEADRVAAVCGFAPPARDDGAVAFMKAVGQGLAEERKGSEEPPPSDSRESSASVSRKSTSPADAGLIVAPAESRDPDGEDGSAETDREERRGGPEIPPVRIMLATRFGLEDAREKARDHWLFHTERLSEEEWRKPQDAPPAPPKSPLIPWRRLHPFVTRAQSRLRPGRRLAMRAVVESLARMEVQKRVPRLPVWRWTPGSWIIVDLRQSLTPLHDDMIWLLARWWRAIGESGLRCVAVNDGDPPDSLPPPETPVLYLGDLGMLPRGPVGSRSRSEQLTAQWTAYGRRLLRRGCSCTALVLCPRDRWDPEVSSVWSCACWDVGANLPDVRRGLSAVPSRQEQQQEALAELRALAAPAYRVDPPLLRALRLLLPAALNSVGAEYDLFQTSAASLNYFHVPPSLLHEARERFAGLNVDTRREVAMLLSEHHAGYAAPVRAREALTLQSCGAPLSKEQTDEARDCIHRACAMFHALAAKPEGASRLGELGLDLWSRVELSSVTPRTTQETREEVAIAWKLARMAAGAGPEERPPEIAGVDLGWLEKLPDTPAEQWDVRMTGETLHMVRHESAAGDNGVRIGTPLALLPAASSMIMVTRTGDETMSGRDARVGDMAVPNALECERLELRSDRAWVAFEPVVRPGRCSEFGWDRFGAYAAFVVEGVEFRFRWIPPGTFQMGSPRRELGRSADEEPRHRVVIEHGFWLQETPVTQKQYQATTGENPAHFADSGPDAPVERVSWSDAQGFCGALHDKLAPAEATFRLPSEAEWEYACRAHSETALYSGDGLTDEHRCESVGRLGWYGANSGHRTHPVRQKQANAFGLFDMLGNVWEYCKDRWHDDYKGAPQDGGAWLDPGTEMDSNRVFRGGSWGSGAWGCRCAGRAGDGPDYRFSSLGFRLVLVPSPKEWTDALC